MGFWSNLFKVKKISKKKKKAIEAKAAKAITSGSKQTTASSYKHAANSVKAAGDTVRKVNAAKAKAKIKNAAAVKQASTTITSAPKIKNNITNAYKNTDAHVTKSTGQSSFDKWNRKGLETKSENNYLTNANAQRKAQNGMSNADINAAQHAARQSIKEQQKIYEALQKGTGEKYGVKKGFADRAVKAEEKSAKENPFMYNFMRGSSVVDTKSISQATAGKAAHKTIDTKKADNSVAGKAGYMAGNALQYMVTGAPAEGALAKGATKLAGNALKKDALKTVAKALAKKESNSLTKKAGRFAARRAADAIAGAGINASQAATTAAATVAGAKANNKKIDKTKKQLNTASKTVSDNISKIKAAYKAGRITKAQYDKMLRNQVKAAVQITGANAATKKQSTSFGKEFGKNMAANTAMDIGFGAVADVAGKGFKAVSKAKAADKAAAKAAKVNNAAKVAEVKAINSKAIKSDKITVKTAAGKNIQVNTSELENIKLPKKEKMAVITDSNGKKAMVKQSDLIQATEAVKGLGGEYGKRVSKVQRDRLFGSDVTTRTPGKRKTQYDTIEEYYKAKGGNTKDLITPKNNENLTAIDMNGTRTVGTTKYTRRTYAKTTIDKWRKQRDLTHKVAKEYESNKGSLTNNLDTRSIDDQINGEFARVKNDLNTVYNKGEKRNLAEYDIMRKEVGESAGKKTNKQLEDMTGRLWEEDVARVREGSEPRFFKESKVQRYLDAEKSGRDTSAPTGQIISGKAKNIKERKAIDDYLKGKIDDTTAKERIIAARKEKAAKSEQAKAEPELIKTKAEEELAMAKRHLEEAGTKIAGKEETPSAKEKGKKIFKSLQKDFSNSLQGVEDFANTFKKSNPELQKKLEASTNSLRQANEKATRHIFNGQLDYNENQVGESLVDIFKGFNSNEEAKAFDDYMFHKHNIDRVAQDKPVFGEGVTAKDSELISKELEKQYPDFVERAKRVRTYLDNLQKVRVDSGLISQGMKDELDGIYKNYVPTYRAKIKGATDSFGNTISVKEQKAAKGSDKDLIPLRDQMAKLTQQTWQGAETNKLLKDIADAQQAQKILADGGTIEDIIDSTTFLEKDNDKCYLKFFENGVPKRVETSPEIYEALVSHNKNGFTDKEWFNAINKGMAKISTPYKKLITSWNPFFIVRNFARDFGESLIQSKDTIGFIKSIPKAVQEMGTRGKYYEAMMNSGTGHSSFFDLEKEITSDKGWFRRNIADRVERANQVVEMLPRLTEYVNTIDKYGGIEKATKDAKNYAALNASDITVNFGRSGNVGRQLNRGLVPFFNPGMQGFDKAIRNFTGANGYKGYLSLAAKATAFGIVPSVINELILSDNPYYQQLNARDKQNYFIFSFPPFKKDSDTFIKIPKSRIGSVFGLIPQALVSKDKQEWATMLKVAGNNIAPVNPFTSNIFAPITGAASNKTWYGSPIESEALKQLPAGERTDANTSALATKIGAATGLSPKKIDYMINSYGGVAAQIGLPSLTPSRQSENALSRIVKKNAIIDSTYQNNLATKYYDKLDKLTLKKNSAHATKEDKAAYKNFNNYSTRLRTINDAIHELQMSSADNKEDKLVSLNKYRNELMNQALTGKKSTNKIKDLDMQQKYLGTEYVVKNDGNKTTKKAVNEYKKLGGKIDNNFYKSYRNMRILKDAGCTDGLSTAVAIASGGNDKKLYKAYGLTEISGNMEDTPKSKRAAAYIKNGGSIEEYSQLKKAVSKSVKMKGDKTSQSFINKAYALVKANASNRAYNLFDIRAKNVQKAINMAAVGITPQQIYDLKQKYNADHKGNLRKAEAVSAANTFKGSKKGAAFAALYSYDSGSPFATRNYSIKDVKKTSEIKGSAKVSSKYITVKRKIKKSYNYLPTSVANPSGKSTYSKANKTGGITAVSQKGVYMPGYFNVQNKDVTETVKKKVKVKAKVKKDNSTLVPATSSGSSSGRSYSRRRSSGSSGGSGSKSSGTVETPKLAQQKQVTLTQPNKRILTDAEIRALLKRMINQTK